MRLWAIVGMAAIAYVILAVTGVEANQTQSVFERLRTTTDIGWLEDLASKPGAPDVIAPSGISPKDLRQRAYVRLGAIGSADAVAALRRIETDARSWSLLPSTISMGRYPHPAGHFSDYDLQPIATIADAGGTTYGVIRGRFLGGADIFLTSTRHPNDASSWSRPLLIPGGLPDQIEGATMAWDGPGALVLTFMPVPPGRRTTATDLLAPSGLQTRRFVLEDVKRDRDADGWTDLEEARLGLDPRKADSDGDGVADGLDVCPKYAPSPMEGDDEEAAILRKAFFAGYGIHWSRDVLLVSGNSRPLQLWGSKGPVLFGVDRSEWLRKYGSAPPLLSWKLTTVSATDATVTLSDFEGAMAGGGYTAKLRKIGGEWFVVSYLMNWIN